MALRKDGKALNKKQKITYFLGAGASFGSVPIWQAQSTSMIEVAVRILHSLKDEERYLTRDGREEDRPKNKMLHDIFSNLKDHGKLAKQYGSIDIYAKRLYLLGLKEELNNLKFYLSVYFDLWENMLAGERVEHKFNEKSKVLFEKIDKRYYSLFSILLEKGDSYPKLNENVSFISWNYDLQLERAYESFLKEETTSLVALNYHFPFMENDNMESNKIIHLNGFRGMFQVNGFRGMFQGTIEPYETVDRKYTTDRATYLNALFNTYSDFNKGRVAEMNYHNTIRYAWETTSAKLNAAKSKMRETNVLVIVGYSFPAFNREIDQTLINEFLAGDGNKKVVYQDPNPNEDLINLLFKNFKNLTFEKLNKKQFHIPHEFLF